MDKVILYPTETVYALGVDPLNERAWRVMCDIKGRPDRKPASWLVKNSEEIYRYAEVTPKAKVIIDEFLPGPLTVILKAKPTVPTYAQAADGTISFRVSSDPVASELIASSAHPITCTSANLHRHETMATPEEILKQLGAEAALVSEVYDDGARKGVPSTVIRCIDDEVEMLREGAITLPGEFF